MELRNVLYSRNICLENFEEGEGYGVKLLVNIALTEETNGFAMWEELIDRSEEDLRPQAMVGWFNASSRAREDALDAIVARARKWQDRSKIRRAA